MSNTKVEALFSGYCDPNGQAAFGSMVRVAGEVVHRNSGYCGYGPKMSLNVAEYSGALDTLTEAVKYKGTFILQGNSRMVIMQLGPDLTYGLERLKAKDGLYLPHYRKAVRIVNEHRERMLFHWIPVHRNAECHNLSKRAVLDRYPKLLAQPRQTTSLRLLETSVGSNS